MSATINDLAGRRFNRLAVIRLAYMHPRSGRAYWMCRCDCGTERAIASTSLTGGGTLSCGCHRRDRASALRALYGGGTRHGKSGSSLYQSWLGLRARCLKPQNKDYAAYGGRGITVCARWRDSFEAFLADMGERPPGLSIDRIDNDRGYEPGNCRWATPAEQTRNRRPRSRK